MNTRIISVLVSLAVLAFSSEARIAAQRPTLQPFTLDDEKTNTAQDTRTETMRVFIVLLLNEWFE